MRLMNSGKDMLFLLFCILATSSTTPSVDLVKRIAMKPVKFRGEEEKY